MRRLIAPLLLIAALLTWGGHVLAAHGAGEIRIGAAISLRAVVEELGRRFEEETGNRVSFTFGSSGQVMGQIRNGAPIDLFISAAHAQMEQLAGEKLIEPSSRRVVATNVLVLVVPADRPGPAGFEELGGPEVRRIAMGEPRTVPAGAYARETLEHLKIWAAVQERVVYGTNVRQVLAYVERGEVDAGIVYRTDAVEAGEKIRIVATAEPGWHAPIEYPAAIVAGSRSKQAASAFLDFLGSEEGRRVLTEHGFGLPEDPAATRPAQP